MGVGAWIGEVASAPVRWLGRHFFRGGTETAKGRVRPLTRAALAEIKTGAPQIVDQIIDRLEERAPQLFQRLARHAARAVADKVIEHETEFAQGVDWIHQESRFLLARTLLRFLLVALHVYLTLLVLSPAKGLVSGTVSLSGVERFAWLLAVVELVIAFVLGVVLPVLRVPPRISSPDAGLASLLAFVGLAAFLIWSSMASLWTSEGAVRPSWTESWLLAAGFAAYGVGLLAFMAWAARRHGGEPAAVKARRIVDRVLGWLTPASQDPSPTDPSSRAKAPTARKRS
jgi:hypothetical protein